MPKSKGEILKVLNILQKTHGQTMLEELSYFTPFQITVATLLSARTKDATTIPIVKEFFKKYPNPEDVAQIPIPELEKWFYGIGFFRVKARNVQKLAQMIIEEFAGKVPNTLEQLTNLPGVGRKTANCVLTYAFKKPAIAVDIHVHRICNTTRLHWIDTQSPEESEQELMRIIPKERWIDINKLIVDHGQRICAPVRPKCDQCTVTKYCEYKDKRIKS